ncbi:sensor histidine kinase KdpD [Dactylosporangium roseum]|uniref:histidine kinase n=1 Tax=Dactylosporangium roseum TaxID=47989 RepID=A0ABY5Z037_9ACTN|nr:ATP-binding protein [Dactylosporangium roseum]UWZ33854.1 sensor histidine kinase KdpD [Dactylosporangium roseum]
MTTRGTLRVYLGAAPGVGKTYKMLEEGRRRKERGTDVVVGFVETHGRPFTEAMLDGLEVVPRQDMTYRGSAFTELDLDAVLARRPEVALVDELAHTNVPGSRHAKRWQDIEELLDAGVDVLTTVNIQHLESLNDVVEQITGVPQRETVPDAVVRRAEQIELVDMTPEALRRRMAHGNIYKPEKIDAALGNYFRVGNLTALRELALLWLADKVDEQLDRYRADHNIDTTWEARERVVVALTGGPEGDTLIRRAARVAARTKGADLMAVHVVRGDGLSGGDPANLTRQRLLAESLDGTYHQVVGADVPAALLDFARGVNATQLVLGASRRGRLAQILAPGVGVTTTAESGSIDVHLVSHEQARRGRLRLGQGESGLTLRRRLLGFALALAGLPVLTIALDELRAEMTLPSDILAYLVLAVAVALVGGLLPALVCAVGGFLLLNWYFTPPLYEFTVAERENVFALVAFVFVAMAVATVVDRAARRARDAARASAEAQTLATLAGSVLHGDNPLDALLERVRESFGLISVTLLERSTERGAWRIVASVGGKPCTTPAEGQTEVPINDDVSLVLRGHPLPASDRRLIEAFAAHAVIALRQQRLGEQAATARSLEEVDKLRTALLSAVSHDLRTPLASAKAAVGSLRSHDVAFSPADQEELLATAEESLDKLTRLVENLLDMSRVQAGALAMTPHAVSVAEAVPHAIDELGPFAAGVRVSIPDDLPEVHADPALLERVLVNVLANAVRYSPPGSPPLISASEHAGQVEIRVVDHGPGIPAADRERVFQPFQRLGDRDNATGVGLGLALSRGLAEAMGGTLLPEHTPGGGLTMTLALPSAERAGVDHADPVLLAHLDVRRTGKETPA